MVMGKRLGLGSRKENLRSSLPDREGPSEGQQDWAPVGCSWPVESCPLCRPAPGFSVESRQHWLALLRAAASWAPTNWMPSLSDQGLSSHDIWLAAPDMHVCLLPIKRIASFCERYSFTSREFPSPISTTTPSLPYSPLLQKKKEEGKLFGNLFLVGSLKRSFMFIF